MVSVLPSGSSKGIAPRRGEVPDALNPVVSYESKKYRAGVAPNAIPSLETLNPGGQSRFSPLTDEIIAAFRIVDPTSEVTRDFQEYVEKLVEETTPPGDPKPAKVQRYLSHHPGLVAVTFKDTEPPMIFYGVEAFLRQPRPDVRFIEAVEIHETKHLAFRNKETDLEEEISVEAMTVKEMVRRNISPEVLTSFLRASIHADSGAKGPHWDPYKIFSKHILAGIDENVRISALEAAHCAMERYGEVPRYLPEPLQDDHPLIKILKRANYASPCLRSFGADFDRISTGDKLLRITEYIETLPRLDTWTARDLALLLVKLPLDASREKLKAPLNALADAIIDHWTHETGGTCSSLYGLLSEVCQVHTTRPFNIVEAIREFSYRRYTGRFQGMLGIPASRNLLGLGRFGRFVDAACRLWSSKSHAERGSLGKEVNDAFDSLPHTSLDQMWETLHRLGLPTARGFVLPGGTVPWQPLVRSAIAYSRQGDHALTYALLRIGLDDHRLVEVLPIKMLSELIRQNKDFVLHRLGFMLHSRPGHLLSPSAGVTTPNSSVGYVVFNRKDRGGTRRIIDVATVNISDLHLSEEGRILSTAGAPLAESTRRRYSRINCEEGFAVLEAMDEKHEILTFYGQMSVLSHLGDFRDIIGAQDLLGLSDLAFSPDAFLVVNRGALVRSQRAQARLVAHIRELQQSDPEGTRKMLTAWLTNPASRKSIVESCIPIYAGPDADGVHLSEELRDRPWSKFVCECVQELLDTPQQASFWMKIYKHCLERERIVKRGASNAQVSKVASDSMRSHPRDEKGRVSEDAGTPYWALMYELTPYGNVRRAEVDQRNLVDSERLYRYTTKAIGEAFAILYELGYGLDPRLATWDEAIEQLEKVLHKMETREFGELLNETEGSQKAERSLDDINRTELEYFALQNMLDGIAYSFQEAGHVLDFPKAVKLMAAASNPAILGGLVRSAIQSAVSSNLNLERPLLEQVIAIREAFKHQLYSVDVLGAWVRAAAEALQGAGDPDGEVRMTAAVVLLNQHQITDFDLRQHLHEIWLSGIVAAPLTREAKVDRALRDTELFPTAERSALLVQLTERIQAQKGDIQRVCETIGDEGIALAKSIESVLPDIGSLFLHLKDHQGFAEELLTFLTKPEDVTAFLAKPAVNFVLMGRAFGRDLGQTEHPKHFRNLHRAYRFATWELKVVLARNFVAPPFVKGIKAQAALSARVLRTAVPNTMPHFKIVSSIVREYLRAASERAPQKWPYLVTALEILAREGNCQGISFGHLLGHLLNVCDDPALWTIAQEAHADYWLDDSIRTGLAHAKHRLPPLNRIQRFLIEKHALPARIDEKILERGEPCGRGRFVHAFKDRYEAIPGTSVDVATLMLLPGAETSARMSFDLIEEAFRRGVKRQPYAKKIVEYIPAARESIKSETDFRLLASKLTMVAELLSRFGVTFEGVEICVQTPKIYDVDVWCMVLEYCDGTHCDDLTPRDLEENLFLRRNIVGSVAIELLLAVNGTIDQNPHGGNRVVSKEKVFVLDPGQVVAINPDRAALSELGKLLQKHLPDVERGVWPFRSIPQGTSSYVRAVERFLAGIADRISLLPVDDRLAILFSAIKAQPLLQDEVLLDSARIGQRPHMPQIIIYDRLGRIG